MAAVVPKGFEVVPDERLPDAQGLEGWRSRAQGAPVDLTPGDHEIGREADGRPRFRKVLPNGDSVEGSYDDNGTWQSSSAISGDIGDVPEGFEPLPTDLPFGEGEQGTVAADSTPLLDDEQVTEPESDYTMPRVGAGTAARRGLTAGAMFGFDDEFAAGAGTLANKLAQIIGVNDTTAPMGEVYQQLLQQERDEKDAAYDQHPYAYGAGFVPGAVLSAPFVGGRVAQGTTRLGTAANLAGAGARAGAVGGAGNNEGGLTDLAGNVIQGAVDGAVAAPLVAGAARYTLEPLAQGITGLIGRLRNGEGVTGNAMNTGLEALARRVDAPMGDPQIARDMVASGVQPRLIDQLSAEGQAVARAATHQPTPAREDLARHSREVYNSMADRVTRQANENITDAPMTARQLDSQVRGDRVLETSGERDIIMSADMEPLRPAPVAITDSIKEVLSTREGQAALRGAEGLMTGRGEREAARTLLAAARKYAKGPTDPEDLFRKEVKGWDDLPEVLKSAYRKERPDLMNASDPFEGITLSLDMADKFARAMRGRAKKTPGLERVARDFANTVRGAARESVPGYSDLLDDYAARSRVGEAAAGEGRFANTDFLKTPPDQFGASVRAASSEPAAVMRAAPSPIEGGAAQQPTISEADALRTRARDDVVDRASGGRGGANALGVADQLATGRYQRARNEQLLGEEGARRLERGMESEVRRYQNTSFIDPSRGSKTYGMSADDDSLLNQGASAAADIATSGKTGVIRAVTRFMRSNGIRGVDAERLTRDVISEDPRRIREAIDFLERRGLERARARSLVRSISGNLGGRVGGAMSYDGPPDGSGRARASVRSVRNTQGRTDKTRGER